MIHSRPSAHPPRRGPFAALSKIVRDKRPVYNSPVGGDRRLYNALPSIDLPPEQMITLYLEFEHNDAEVIDCRRGKTTFSLTINQSEIWKLASTVKEGSWNDLRRSFPATLRFEGVSDLIVVQQREVGNYRLLRSSLDGLATMLWDVIALRCVGRDEKLLHFDLMFNGRREIPTLEEVENDVSVLLTCETVSIVEDLKQNWIDAIGEETLHILEAFLKERPIQYGHRSEFENFVADQGSARPRSVVDR